MRACGSSTSTMRASAGSANGPGRAPISAALTQAIAEAGAAAIAFDIVFSEADRTSPRFLAEREARLGATPALLATLRALPDHDARFAETLAAAPSVLGFFLTQDRPGAAGPAQGRVRRRRHRSRREPHRLFGRDPAAAAIPGGGGRARLRLDQGRRRRHRPPRAAGRPGERSAGALAFGGGAAGRPGRRRTDRQEQRRQRRDQCRRSRDGRPQDRRGRGAGHRARRDVDALYAGRCRSGSCRPGRSCPGGSPPAEMERLFSGRIVLVGAGAIGLRDLVATPMRERELGVVVHAQAIEQMVLGRFPRAAGLGGRARNGGPARRRHPARLPAPVARRAARARCWRAG